jgi:signal transduction histidine kinase
MGTGRIPVALDLAPLPPILTDAEQVRTVLDNLLLNALEALGDEGEVRIRTVAHNGSVSLEMSDTGPGIPDSVLRAGLFTPFNTTKPHGLGIGLYQVKFIVHAHGGHLQVTSAPGRGTAVRITFPAAPA